jgi:hypothetical protein
MAKAKRKTSAVKVLEAAEDVHDDTRVTAYRADEHVRQLDEIEDRLFGAQAAIMRADAAVPAVPEWDPLEAGLWLQVSERKSFRGAVSIIKQAHANTDPDGPPLSDADAEQIAWQQALMRLHPSQRAKAEKARASELRKIEAQTARRKADREAAEAEMRLRVVAGTMDRAWELGERGLQDMMQNAMAVELNKIRTEYERMQMRVRFLEQKSTATSVLLEARAELAPLALEVQTSARATEELAAKTERAARRVARTVKKATGDAKRAEREGVGAKRASGSGDDGRD